MKCPSCGSENCQFVTSSETHSKSFGAGDACCGFLLFGPIGILCGLCGAESYTESKEYWICHQCGKKFSAKEATRQQSNNIKLNFYTELVDQEIRDLNPKWKKIKEGYNSIVRNSELFANFMWMAPATETELYQDLKTCFAGEGYKNEQIYFMILEGGGLLYTDKGIFIEDQLENDIRNIFLFSNTVYINQSCMRFVNSIHAKSFFDFMEYLYPNARKEQYINYEDLLLGLLKAVPSVSTNTQNKPSKKSHYSYQNEYKRCVALLSIEVENAYKKSNLESYESYISKKESRRKLLNILRILMVVTDICTFLMGGPVVGIVCTIILLIVLSSVVGGEKWNSYTSLIPSDIYTLFVENDAESKTGLINPKKYRDIINNLNKEKYQVKQIGKYCRNCGTKLKEGWEHCPNCGNVVM